MCQTRQPRIQNITVKISHLQPLESKGMQLPASAHLRWREAFIKEETHRTVPFLCLLRLICGRRGRQNQPSGPPPHPSFILSCQETVTAPPHKKTDLEEPPQRIYLTGVCFRTDRGESLIVTTALPEDFRGAVVSEEALRTCIRHTSPKSFVGMSVSSVITLSIISFSQ